MIVAFDDDGLSQARKLIAELEAEGSSSGNVQESPDDAQQERLVRVLRILTDQIEQLRADHP